MKVPPASPRASMALTALLLAFACQEFSTPDEQPAVKTSPNASIVPQPLLSGKSLVSKPAPTAVASATGTSLAARSMKPPKAPPVPVPYRVPTPRPDRKPPRAATPVVLEARFEWPERHVEPNFHGLTEAENKAARDRLKRSVRIDLRSEDRMAVRFEGNALPLPAGSRLLARADRLGFIAEWPSEKAYRLLAPGMLRTLMTEGRADVTPALTPIARTVGQGKRFGLPSETLELQTPHGSIALEQVRVEGLGYGAALLCRMLLELVAVAPASSACGPNRLPVVARFAQGGKTTLVFAVNSLQKRPESGEALPQVPPPMARMLAGGLPERPLDILSNSELAALKRGPKEGERAELIVVNNTPQFAYMMLGTVPVAISPPYQRHRLRGLRPGDYPTEFVNFLGESLADKALIKVPGVVSIGTPAPDAGAAP